MQVDEPDYDSRMAAYSRLTPPGWRALGAGLPPLVHHCAYDLRNGDDLGGCACWLMQTACGSGSLPSVLKAFKIMRGTLQWPLPPFERLCN